MTDGGTLIMRASTPPPPSVGSVFETQSMHTPSLMPFALDLEDYEEPARNGDAMGVLRHTSQIDWSRSTTNASFWSGLSAGLATLGMGLAIAFTAFTAEPAASASIGRDPHVVSRLTSSLRVESPDFAETKLVAKKKSHRVRRAVVASEDGAALADPAEVESIPELTETN